MVLKNFVEVLTIFENLESWVKFCWSVSDERKRNTVGYGSIQPP